ncbi:MAG: response regulator transcription factor [Patescibacteria group bacterium]
MRILLVEDDSRLSESIKNGLVEEGFAVDTAFDGNEGLYLTIQEQYDVIILDVMLPKRTGIEVCREIRDKNIKAAILMLTAKSKLDDKVEGLNAGADDYLTKPFDFPELLARIQALLRRTYKQPSSTIKVGDLEIDPQKHIAKRGGNKINLTPKEFAILDLLAKNKEQVVTRTQIIEHTWDYNFDSMSNVVDVFIASVRKKVDTGHKVKLIKTIHGVGYKLSSLNE